MIINVTIVLESYDVKSRELKSPQVIYNRNAKRDVLFIAACHKFQNIVIFLEAQYNTVASLSYHEKKNTDVPALSLGKSLIFRKPFCYSG